MSARPAGGITRLRRVGEAGRYATHFLYRHGEPFDLILRARVLALPATRKVSSSRLMPRSAGSTLTSTIREPLLDRLAQAEWDAVHNINLKGIFSIAQAIARRMVISGRKLAIGNLSSSSARDHVLVSTRRRIIGRTRSMALALASHCI